jgi:predicted Zn finger-like uncharacterized protein
MPFAFSCPHCGAAYRIKDELAGKRTKCQKCGEPMTLAPPAQETTAGGSTVYRHQAKEREFEWSHGDGELMEALDAHFERHIDKVESVYHEIMSDLVHLDVHYIPPADERPWHTLLTSGMAERPMHTPPEVENFDYAELMVCLPATWQVGDEAFKDERNYWPVGALKYMARLPHEYDTWLGPGHTVPNGDPPAPFADNVKFCCMMVAPALGVPDEFHELELPDGRTVHMLSIIPLYKEEMDFKLRKGSDALGARLVDFPVEEFFNPKRRNVAAKRFGIF